MDLQTLWFIIIAFFFAGYFLLEGFDFGVGMLLPFLGGKTPEEKAARRSAAVKAIGPVWDGNEVWLITAGAALFASFPEWYATLFSGFYLPLLLILLALILRGVGLEWRTKVDTQKWRNVSDVLTAIGSWVPALLWGVAFANIVRGVAIDENRQIESGFDGLIALLNPVGILGGLAFVSLFMLHGAMFLGFKTAEPLRSRGHDIGLKWLSAPAVLLTLAFALWIQYDGGKPAGWAIIAAMVLAIVVGVAALARNRDGWAFASTSVAVVGLVVLIFVSLFPYLMPTTLEGGVALDIYNSASSDYTLKVMSWAALLFIPGVLFFQGWTYWVFRRRVQVVPHAAPENPEKKQPATSTV